MYTATYFHGYAIKWTMLNLHFCLLGASTTSKISGTFALLDNIPEKCHYLHITYYSLKSNCIIWLMTANTLLITSLLFRPALSKLPFKQFQSLHSHMLNLLCLAVHTSTFPLSIPCSRRQQGALSIWLIVLVPHISSLADGRLPVSICVYGIPEIRITTCLLLEELSTLH